MLIKVMDKKTGIVYSNDMSGENKHAILSINFCSSYTQVTVQDEIVDGNMGVKYPAHDIILPPLGTKPNWVDLIATQGDNEGTWIINEDLALK